LIVETIKLIDNIYKKGRYTKERWKRIENRLNTFKKQIFADNLLPVSAVDPYCLYSEGNKNIPVSDTFRMRSLLSVEKYENFRKLFYDLYTYLDNFYNQFDEVLLARLKKQDINSINNPRLAMFNLYAAAKVLYSFQQEYDFLFSEYTVLDKLFLQQELENTLTLVNVWRNVLDFPPNGQAIAYDAKLRYRKSKNYFKYLISEIRIATGGDVFETSRYIYIASTCNVDEDISLESEYTNLVLILREIFESAVFESSDRWYCETQGVNLAYIPIISGMYIPVAFSIPFYKLFDKEVSNIAKTMLPCEIEADFKDKLFGNTDRSIWTMVMEKIQEIRFYLKRFNQVVQIKPDGNCIKVFESFKEQTKVKIQELWKDFALCESLVNKSILNTDEQIIKMAKKVKVFLGRYEEIIAYIEDGRNTTNIIQNIDDISAFILLLQELLSNTNFYDNN